MATTKTEYRVIPVARYHVTRYTESDDGCRAVESLGEFPNKASAEETAKAHAAYTGGEVTTNILVRGQPHDAGALLRNIAEDFGPLITDGVVVIVNKDGWVEVFGLAPVDAGMDPHLVLAAGAKKLRHLGVLPA